jgi:exopolysaccharide biosynthesis protein
MKYIISFILFCLSFIVVCAQDSRWRNVDSDYGPLPSSMHIYFTDIPADTGKFRAFYLVADLRDKKLDFTTDTTLHRRLTPSGFYSKNHNPLIVMNGTFFSFETNQNLNLVITKGKLTSFNRQSIPGRGKDTFTYRHIFPGTFGISKKRNADIAWVVTDSSKHFAYGIQSSFKPFKDFLTKHSISELESMTSVYSEPDKFILTKWKMQTAIGGGPVLLQNGEIQISNNEELKFAGKAIHDRHPRTAIGYTKDHKLILLVIEGRNPEAHGATLAEEAQILKDLGCVEGLNLDGGGSSCLLVNGKETIKPSDKTQRAVPAVFIIQTKK